MDTHRSRRSTLLALLAAPLLALALVACRGDAPPAPDPIAAEQAAEATPVAAEPASPAATESPTDDAAQAAAVAVPTPDPATIPDAAQTIRQAYGLMMSRLFREIAPEDVLTAGWRGVREEAGRQGLAERSLREIGAGTASIDAFSDEFNRFLAGPAASLNGTRLAQAAIRGMTEAVGDSHTRYVSPQQVQAQESVAEGSYVGIGIRVADRTDSRGLAIIEVYKNSPAEQAGLRPGDRIVRVDGNEIAGRQQSEISGQIRGAAGTAVNLTLSNATGDLRDLTITRGRVTIPIVESEIKAGEIGFIKLSSFPRRTATGVDAAAEIDAALLRLQGQGARAYILDLRGNPGGDVFTTVNITSNFVQESPIFVAVSRDGKRTTYPANRSRRPVNGPLAVLIDGGSASGAEVLVSAVKEYEAGYLIGTRTCGCLSVGQPQRLGDDSQIIVTTQQALTGRYEQSLEGVGLEPHEVVRGEQAQLDRAIEYLKGRLP